VAPPVTSTIGEVVGGGTVVAAGVQAVMMKARVSAMASAVG